MIHQPVWVNEIDYIKSFSRFKMLTQICDKVVTYYVEIRILNYLIF